jgi:hypothetical protein
MSIMLFTIEIFSLSRHEAHTEGIMAETLIYSTGRGNDCLMTGVERIRRYKQRARAKREYPGHCKLEAPPGPCPSSAINWAL